MTRGFEQPRMNMMHVATSKGFAVDVLLDRCLDLGKATYRGLPVAWMSGEPRYLPTQSRTDWSDRFVGGLVATCGLDNVGPACHDQGRFFPQHGQIGGVPARNVCSGTRKIAGRRIVWIAGDIVQPESTLRLRRHILIPSDEARVQIRDAVSNVGTVPEPLMLQYHCNFGQPFVAPKGRILVPRTVITPRDSDAAERLDRWHVIDPPLEGEVERVFCHEQYAARWASAYIVPPDDSPASTDVVRLRYFQPTLPYLWQWRLLSTTAYVMGIEPANCSVRPRDAARRSSRLSMLAPGQTVRFGVEIALCPRVECIVWE